MDVTQYGVIPTLFQSATQEPRVSQVIQGHGTKSLETEMDETEVLRDDWSSRAREVEREGVFN